MKWTVHKPEDCTLGKEQDDVQDKPSKQQITANQATYARLFAQLALQAADKRCCAPAWLALGFLAMAKPTIMTIMQAIFILTFIYGYLPWFTTSWHFCQLPECRAPRYQALHSRLCQTKLSARKNRNSVKKKEDHENLKKKKKKQK